METAVHAFEWQQKKRIEGLPESGYEEIAGLIAFWNAHRQPGMLPSRSVFDPFNLRPWLGYVDIYEFHPQAQDFLIRLNGSHVVELTGEDWTGRMISEVDRKFRSTLHADLMECMQEAGPILHTMPIFQRPHLRAVRLLLPLAREKGGPADFVLMALYAR